MIAPDLQSLWGQIEDDLGIDGAKFKNRRDADQGFVDQHGVFMSRREAYLVALAADQVRYPERCAPRLDVGMVLYSEGLY
ncbi:MAG: hypothetical protein KF822_09570 [Steroidobacteraceae bacterium]|nr:hypothetical protein [Steroidobacteraceae bacterium]